MKITTQFEDREIDTLARLVHAELHRGPDGRGLYQRRSLVRLAAAVQSLAKTYSHRWKVLSDAPRWVFDYLTAPLFPEIKPVKRSRPPLTHAAIVALAKPKHKPKRKRMLPAAAGLGLKPGAPPPE